MLAPSRPSLSLATWRSLVSPSLRVGGSSSATPVGSTPHLWHFLQDNPTFGTLTTDTSHKYQPPHKADPTNSRRFPNGTHPGLLESPISVAEIVNGLPVAYPNAAMNSWRPGDPATVGFVNVQSVFVDHFDRLWILEPGNFHPNPQPAQPPLPPHPSTPPHPNPTFPHFT